MGLQTIAPDILMTCPLQESHRILKSRMQFHLVRCFKNHPNVNKIRCPWNPLHFVDRCEYLDHCHNKCEDLANVMGSKILSEADAGRDVASIPLSTVVNIPAPPTDEDWDAEPHTGTYDPLQRSEDLPILRGSIGLSKAKRKEFKLKERQRHQRLENDLPIQIKSSTKSNKPINATRPCCPPHKQPISITSDASLVEDANSSRISKDGDSYARLPRNNITLFDKQFEASQNIDETFGMNSSSRSGNNGATQKIAKSCAEISKRSLKLSETKTAVETGELQLQDEAASLMTLVSPNGTQSGVDDLTRQLAKLKTMQKCIDEMKSAICHQISQQGNNGADSVTSIPPNVEITTASKTKESLDKKRETAFTGISRKCAANFGQASNSKYSPMIGIGRGSLMMNFEVLKNPRPGVTRGVPRDFVGGLDADQDENVESVKTLSGIVN